MSEPLLRPGQIWQNVDDNDLGAACYDSEDLTMGSRSAVWLMGTILLVHPGTSHPSGWWCLINPAEGDEARGLFFIGPNAMPPTPEGAEPDVVIKWRLVADVP